MMKKIIVNRVEVGEYMSTGDDMADAKAMSEILERMGYSPRQTPGRSIFDNAVQFATAASYIYEKDLVASPWNLAAVVPFLVNAAFAIELYLKALALQHGARPARAHALVDLFDVLPQSAREAITRAIPAAAAALGLDPARDFRADVAALNDVFVDWRYCYERDSLGPVYMAPIRFVAGVLHKAFQEVDIQNAAASSTK